MNSSSAVKKSDFIVSPRSKVQLESLAVIEQNVLRLQNDLFLLADRVNEMEAKTKLSLLIGQLETVRFKKIDAVVSLDLAEASSIKIARSSLGKQVDILINFAQYLYDLICNDSTTRRKGRTQ